MIKFYQEMDEVQFMGVRIENNLFYVESKSLSLIIENRDGFLLLKHLGKTIKNYRGSNSVYERDHAFSGNPTATNRTFSLIRNVKFLGNMVWVTLENQLYRFNMMQLK